jgi:Carboxypeptidase regulatory-like domain/TonB dependent receptor
MLRPSWKVIWCTPLLVFSMLNRPAVGQSTVDGSIDGHIVDNTGAFVAKVQVTVHNNGTNSDSSALSDGTGYFRVTRLQPGTYTLTFTAQGFTTRKVEQVTVEVDRVTTIDQTLAIGNTSQTVEVTSEAPSINTTSAEIAQNFNQTSINNLPINGRHWTNFVLLTPSAVAGNAFGLISFRGISSLMNNFLVDGTDNMRAFQSAERGYTRVAFSTSQESIQEFQTLTSNYSAQFGRSAGGVINAITKSGTNAFHVNAFWYYRDNDFGATNPLNILSTFDTTTNTLISQKVKPTDKRHQYGGSFSGPLIKNKLFFFYAFDQQKRNFPSVATPGSSSFFNITQASQNLCATTGESAQACLLSRGITQPQINSAVAFLEAQTGFEPRRGDEILSFPKLDWRVNDKTTASIQYTRMRWDSPGGVQTNLINPVALRSFGNDFDKVDSVIGKVDTFFNSRVNNEFRYEWARDFNSETLEEPAPGIPLTGPNGQPPGIQIGTSVAGLVLGTTSQIPEAAYPNERENEIVDTVMWTHGKHTLATGFDYRHVNDKVNFISSQEGIFTFASIADWITQYYASQGSAVGCTATRNALPGTLPCYTNYTQGFITPEGFSYSTNDFTAFVQDDWKVLPNLTLNLGIRYDFEKLPDPQVPNAAYLQTSALPRDYNNIGPRIGFSWDPFRTGKTAIRGGYGIFYGRITNGAIYSVISNTAAAGGQFTLSLNPIVNGAQNPQAPTYPNTLTTGSTTAARGINVYSTSLQNPGIQQADFSIQREIGWKTSLSVSYLLNLGHQLPNFVDLNIAPVTGTQTYTISGGRFSGQTFTVPTYSARINPNFAAVTNLISNVSSNYNGLVVQVDNRLDKSLQFQFSYTFSKSLDYGQNQSLYGDTNDPFDVYNLRADYGPSIINVPHKVTGSLVWQPTLQSNNRYLRAAANGWNVSPTLILQSGLPYSYGISESASPFTTVPNSTLSINGTGGANYLPIAGRNSARNPSTQNVDLRIARSIPLGERVAIEPLVEGFNIFNRMNVFASNATAYTLSGTTLNYSSTFGQPTTAATTVFRERQIQFAVRLTF